MGSDRASVFGVRRKRSEQLGARPDDEFDLF